MNIRELKNIMTPGNKYLGEYNDGYKTYRIAFEMEGFTKNGTKTKNYIKVKNDKLYTKVDDKLTTINTHKVNWLGMLDASKFTLIK